MFNDGSDSDADDSVFSFLKTVKTLDCDEESSVPTFDPVLTEAIENAVLARDRDVLDSIMQRAPNFVDRIVGMCVQVLDGQHVSVVTANPILNHNHLVDICHNSTEACQVIREKVLQYVSSSAQGAEYRALGCMVLGWVYLELFAQCNYTGPELPPKDLAMLKIDGSDSKLTDNALRQLECDGNYPFSCQAPETLLICRAILTAITLPDKYIWSRGIVLDSEGNISLPPYECDLSASSLLALRSLRAAVWLNARANQLHLRLLHKQRYTENPTLLFESELMFATAVQNYGSRTPPDLLAASVHLESGLAQHFFDKGDTGKAAFHRAQVAAGTSLNLTAALGKRTKYQHTDYAQLVLIAQSTLRTATATPADTRSPVTSGASEEEKKWELGTRPVLAAETGEEAAVREIGLNDVIGDDENIILEGGPHLAEETDRGGLLHPIDQSVILAMCLDISNTNPADGLTNEQMLPYIERVLQQPENWMIHSTGLLQRSWIEYDRRKTADRAMLQIQALLDQHTTKLTFSQASYSVIEAAAPVQERVKYIFDIVYPSQYELKKDLALRYMRSQVFASALAIFQELEMWDEIVQCYQYLQKPHRAEMVVRDRLKSKEGQTPYMYTALGDLTNDESCYLKAWEISNGRYARAKRTLGRMCFDSDRYEEAVRHLDDALRVHPLIATAWYLRGIACMRLERWEEAIESFTRCVQQDTEIGEAWGNIGAIHMQLKNLHAAHHALLEALKQKQKNWKILENLMLVTLQLEKWVDCANVMGQLLDLREKSQRPLHLDELRILAVSVAHLAKTSGENDNGQLPYAARTVESLLLRITHAIKSTPAVWDILATFQSILGRREQLRDCRIRQLRALLQEPQWGKHLDKISVVTAVAKELVMPHLDEMSKMDVYGCKSMLSSAVAAIEPQNQSCDDCSELRRLIKVVEEKYNLLVEKSKA